MPLFSSPSPQWADLESSAAAASRMAAVQDNVTGVWGFDPNAVPEGALVYDVTTGVAGIDNTTRVGLRTTLLPSGVMATY